MENKTCAMCGEEIKEVYRSPIFCYMCDVERIEKITASLNQAKERMDEWEERLNGEAN